MGVKSLYLHVPFCKSICAYCDFTRVGYNKKLVNNWLKTIKFELENYNIKEDLKTVYIGGGTPTALDVDELDSLLSYLDHYVKSVDEYTIEINPETIDECKVQLLAKHGINRISIGVESTNQKLLKLMNRKHSFLDVKAAIDLFNKYGIYNISIDLIYSLPFQTMKIWKDTLSDVLELNVKHISIYSLTIEDNSAFKKLGYDHLDDDIESDMYFEAIEFLKKNKFKQYEISNFCLDGYESKHNLAYWHYDDFYGVGLGASGKLNHIRYDNTNNFVDYFNHKFIMERYDEGINDQMFDMLMMSLRLKEGLNIKLFKERFNQSFDEIFGEVKIRLVEQGYLKEEQGYLKCTDKGYPILNNILEEFML